VKPCPKEKLTLQTIDNFIDWVLAWIEEHERQASAVTPRVPPRSPLDGSHISPEERKRMRVQHIGTSRKAASAMIAKIPLPLALHIARCFK